MHNDENLGTMENTLNISIGAMKTKFEITRLQYLTQLHYSHERHSLTEKNVRSIEKLSHFVLQRRTMGTSDDI